MKLQIIERKQKNEGNTAIGRALGLSESTVRSVWKNREKIMKMVKSYGAAAIDNRSRSSNPAMVYDVTVFGFIYSPQIQRECAS